MAVCLCNYGYKQQTEPKGHKPERLSSPDRVTGMDTAPADSGEGKEGKMKIKFSAIIDVGAALKAVEQNGCALRYVKDQTEAVCLKAVEQYGYALQYVKDQTEAVCLKAVEQDGDALRYVLDRELFTAIAAKFGIEIEQ